ncbi:hypothetical protein M0812_12132 [Anaeramoeba flamelloides]|uniref:YhhN-like protein n=1 Tax=Anaeramoeba flamelloides TaxID=1746091 RepID=A0AAV7ZPG9_9EUKA|nr:hypothetical protein M0812_12132 [Anaeramoeba flamelloides]
MVQASSRKFQYILLLLICVCSLIYGFSPWVKDHKRLLLEIFKPLTMCLVIIYAFSLRLYCESKSYFIIIVVGLLFSITGDELLLYHHFVPGLASFLLAHVCYCIAFFPKKRPFNFKFYPLLFWIAFFVLFFVFILPHVDKKLKAPVICYASVLSLMCNFSTEQFLKYRNKSTLIAVIGAILFATSDVILSVNMFITSFKGYLLVNEITYIGGQLGIVTSLNFALNNKVYGKNSEMYLELV